MQHGFKYACRVLVGGHLVAEVLEVLFRKHRAAREEELASLCGMKTRFSVGREAGRQAGSQGAPGSDCFLQTLPRTYLSPHPSPLIPNPQNPSPNP